MYCTGIKTIKKQYTVSTVTQGSALWENAVKYTVCLMWVLLFVDHDILDWLEDISENKWDIFIKDDFEHLYYKLEASIWTSSGSLVSDV